MNNRVPLDQPHPLRGRILFAVSKRCFDRIEHEGKDTATILRKLSALKILLFWVQNRGGETMYSLYTTDGVYSLIRTDDATLLLTSYRPASLRDNNTCLKTGISVQPSGGVSVSITLKDARQLFQFYHCGKRYNEIPSMAEAGPNLLSLLDTLSSSNKAARPVRSCEVYSISDGAEAYLSVAEGYTRTDADLEFARAQQIAPLVCWDFHPAAEYDRQDKIAYSAFAVPYDHDQYAINSKVQLELSEDRILTATIVSANTDGDKESVTLLFDEQISFSTLPNTCQIRPSFSDVQNEVRQDVIDGIRKGEAPALFLANVLGNYQTSGFTKKDLSELDRALQSKKYPPNQSQIEAIHRGIEANDILLVLGPPGTGKTTVILEWVKYFIKQEGKRVLISSQNNKAVDNVLGRLTQEKGISAIRAGSEAKVQANMYPYLLENRLNQMREDVASTVQNNLDQLDQLELSYQNYINEVNVAMAHQQSIENLESSLDEAINQKFEAYRSRLLEQQKQCARLESELHANLDSVRRCEKWLVDPQKHPILRFLLTPIRPIFRRKLRNALDSYSTNYAEYSKCISKSKLDYKYLTAMPKDADLLELSGRISELEQEQEQLFKRFKDPVDDSLIWPNTPWPTLTPSCTVQQFMAYLEAVKVRRERLRLLKSASDEWNEHIQSQSNYALSDLLMESVDLVGGTCIGINSQRKFARVDFDVTIIDESGQIQIHNALVPMSRSPKVIMLGDHKQIPPMADDEQVSLCEERGIDASLLSTSLFERLYENLPSQNKALLDTQYRMPAQIADLLSDWFYEGQYKSFSGKRDMPSICPELFNSPFVVLSTSDAGQQRLEYKPEMGAGNNFEADLIVAIVSVLLKGSFGDALNPSDFGIISPYGVQVDNIRKRIKRSIPSLRPEEIRDMVASLDSFQGQERSIILYSCTRSNTRPANRRRIGFLKELRRLNVALSRPLKELVFVGDIDFLSSCTNGKGTGSEREFSEFIKLMRQHAENSGEFILSKDFQKRLEGV